MSPCQYILPIAKLFLRGDLILDSGWSLFEGTYISRKKIGFLGYKLIKNYSIDFIASHLAARVVLESKRQSDFYCRIFLLSRTKVDVIYTGVDEVAFVPEESYRPQENVQGPVIFFRGKYNPEAGLETLATASFLLKNLNVSLYVASPGLPQSILFASNTHIDRGLHTKSEMASMLANCTFALGQMADHPRLQRTIPHKAFEAAFLGKAYLSARSQGILELFEENSDIACFEPGDPEDLANKIISLLGNLKMVNQLGENMKSTYSTKCSQKILATNFLKIVDSLNLKCHSCST